MLRCECGGEFRNVDPIFPTDQRNQGCIVYDQRRIMSGFASRQCDKCGKMRRQKLRVSKKEVKK